MTSLTVMVTVGLRRSRRCSLLSPIGANHIEIAGIHHAVSVRVSRGEVTGGNAGSPVGPDYIQIGTCDVSVVVQVALYRGSGYAVGGVVGERVGTEIVLIGRVFK